jgi:dTDP-4-amino-4,6-dideoxygalactose transaminase
VEGIKVVFMENSKQIRFRDLSVSDLAERQRIMKRIEKVLIHGQILLGPEVREFEEKAALYCGVKYCVGVSSGTDALLLALRVLNIGPGDEVITTPMSWISTLHAIHSVGATPIFVDTKDDLNMNEALIEKKITQKTKVILPVHFTGAMCNMKVVMDIAKKHNLYVVEDAAQAFGAKLNGKKAGSFGDIGCFSMNPMKVLPACGEAGAVLTNNKNWYERLQRLRYLGTVDREVCVEPSTNAKFDTIQAAVLLEAMEILEENIKQSIDIARQYNYQLHNFVLCPEIPSENNRSVFFDYVIQTEMRDDLKLYLEEFGIETKVRHKPLMPDQPAYSNLPYTHLPNARKLVNQILSLPLHKKMTVEDVNYVSDTIVKFFLKKANHSS